MLKAQKNIYYTNSFFEKDILDKLSFHSARLYNACLFNIRQYFFSNNAYLPFKNQYHLIKNNENFKLLINDSSQQVLRMVDKNFRSFFALLNMKKRGKYSAPIHIPHYLKKDKGWHIYVAGRSCRVKDNLIYIGLSKLFRETYNISQRDITLPLPKNVGNKKIHQIQISPNSDNLTYNYIVVYEDEIKQHIELDKSRSLSIDVGTNNLFTCYDSFNNKVFIIDGRYLKSVNQFFNKQIGKLQAKYTNTDIKWNKTKRFFRLSNKRNNIINECFNKAVNIVIKYCVENKIGNLIIGDFSGSKNGSELNKKSNQNFIQIPHYRLKSKLSSKCEENGIKYNLIEESYTSKACAYNLDEIPTYKDGNEENYTFSGYREKRGIYKVKDISIRYNSDVNGAINIYRKYIKNVSKEREISLELVRAVSTSHPNRIRLKGKQAAESLVQR